MSGMWGQAGWHGPTHKSPPKVLHIEIELDGTDAMSGEDRDYELRRILTELGNRIYNGDVAAVDERKLFDSNGNSVGRVHVEGG